MTQYEILATSETRVCDHFSEVNGISGLTLMEAAGRRIAEAIIQRWSSRPVVILCGPGNNGGDGFVCARLLAEQGWAVSIALLGRRESLHGDAALMAQRWRGDVHDFHAVDAKPGRLLVDAMFGAGLSRPLDEAVAAQLTALAAAADATIAVDLPSGLNGDALAGSRAPYTADLTVSFHRPKPAHLLQPAASQCGELVIGDIGIAPGWHEAVTPVATLNQPDQWADQIPQRTAQSHKHAHGRLLVFSGSAGQTGAARLAAQGGLYAGAGLVTLASPPDALTENASHLTAIMLRVWEAGYQADDLAESCRADACVIGPAAGTGAQTRQAIENLLTTRSPCLLDADALTVFKGHADQLFDSLRPGDVLTPHAGEFERLFPGYLEDADNKLEAVRRAADIAGCTVLLKGADTVIAAPGRLPVVNIHAAPHLATAGSGDVLAGLIGGLMAQGLSGFDAACMGAWLHGDAGRRLGAGLTAEDLPAAVAQALHLLHGKVKQRRKLAKLTGA